MTDNRHILEHKFEDIKAVLLSEHLTHKIIQTSFRDYSAQAEIFNTDNIKLGAYTLYYSPKRNEFSIKAFQNLPDFIAQKIHNFLFAKLQAASEKKTNETIQFSSQLNAYVDGSYLNGMVGYGGVIIQNDEIIFEISGSVDKQEYMSARQVAGELFAVGKILQWCRNNSIKKINIFYDYAGIEAWAVGTWKTNQALTQNYAHFVRSCGIDVRWHKVAAHTGNRWNDYADNLAKQGAASS